MTIWYFVEFISILCILFTFYRRKKLPIIMFEFQNEFVRMSTNAVSFPPFDLLSLLEHSNRIFWRNVFFYSLTSHQSPSRMDNLSRRHSFKIVIESTYYLYTVYSNYINYIRLCMVTNKNCNLPKKKKINK